MPSYKNYKLTIKWEEVLKGYVEVLAKNESQARALFNQNPSEYLENLQFIGHAYPYDMLNMKIESISKEYP